jgi:hypothetical protein
MLFDVERRWWPRAICRWEDHGLFFAPGGQYDRRPSPEAQALWNRAKDICSMCPALKECRRDTLGELYGVFGGRDESERYKIRRALTVAVQQWPEERQLAWGEQLHSMRQGEVSWTSIQAQCGMPQAPAEFLIRTWTAHEAERRESVKLKVVDLELPVLGRRPDFPATQGRRHAWVKHNNLVSDAWYRGETPDGEWIAVTTEAGRGPTHKWVPAKDVHLYRPQAVVILNYVGRPDRDDRSTAPIAHIA